MSIRFFTIRFNYTLLLAGAISTLLFGCTPPDEQPSYSVAEETASIRTLLETQAHDWNEGNIEAFMSGYWRSDSLRFVSGNGYREGWQETLERYKATYPDKANMGELAFELYEIHILSHDAATVLGRFHLERQPPLENLTGLFTLILRKHGDDWKVIHDHTSS